MNSSSLDLLLVNIGSTRKRVYQDLSKDFSAIEPPFWAALTAGFVRNQGYSVKILDANAENFSLEETVELIRDYNPKLIDVVVYGQHPSASTQLMTGVGELCREIKLKCFNSKIILTGLHPSALPERTLREESCDFVAEGEGFYTLLGLLKGNSFSNIPGLWWHENSKIKHNNRAKNIENLTEELKDVAWDLLPFGKYKAHNWQCLDNLDARTNYASLSTSLGCPFKCDFCSISKTFGERRTRYWDPEWVVNQISTLIEKYEVSVFKIIDEMFLLNPRHYLGIADKLIERRLGDKINIWAYARVDTTNEAHLEKLRKAGFKWLCYGFESGNNEIIRSVHKGNFSKEEMIRLNEKVRSFGINVLGNYMFGFPDDNLATMQETLDLALRQNCEFANFYCAIAWPGSKLYEDTIRNGISVPQKWEDYAQHSYNFLPLPTKNLSPEQVLKFRDDAFYKYFTNQNYLNMIEHKFGQKARSHIEYMTRVKLRRKILEV
ncbi:MAG: radical SAM protein [Candidatus Pacearchaeota archaeon]